MEKKKDKDTIDVLLEIDNHSGSDYSNKKLTGLDLQDKDFSKSNLAGANFLQCNLAGSDFSCADLTGTNFTDANCAGVNWDGAKRNGKQVVKYGSIVNGKYSVYGFLAKSKKKTVVLINEANIPEYEYTQAKAKRETALLYNLLVNG